MQRKTIWTIVLGVAAVAAVIALSQVEASAESNDIARLVKLLLLLLVIASGVLLVGRLTPKIGYMVIWVALALVLIVGYSYRHTLERALFPAHDTAGAAGTARFQANMGGDFMVEATVDGVPVTLLVDTGASDVVLSTEDARRLGFDPAAMAYTRRYQTANGIVRGAPVTLGRIEVGGVVLENVRASVNEGDMRQSLLGMSFLGRLDGFEIRNDTLTLYQ